MVENTPVFDEFGTVLWGSSAHDFANYEAL